jgi:ABC-2 type transport system permease protein
MSTTTALAHPVAPPGPALPATALPATALPATALVDRRPPMARLVRLEIRKSLSTRSGRLLAGLAAVLPAVTVAISLGLRQPIPSAAEMLSVLGTLVALLMIALGVLATAGEWTHRTVQTTFLAVPRRHRVLAAKYAGMVLLGAALSAVVAGSSLAVAAVAAGPAFSWAGVGSAAVATIAVGAVMTVTGAGVGAAVTNAPAALVGSYLTLLVGMNLLRAAKPAWALHLDPLQAMADLISRHGSLAGQVGTLSGWLLAATVAGVLVTRRRSLA